MTILYSNGCSYTANQLVHATARYPSLISKHFGWRLIDHAHPGSSNDRIIRTTMRDCIELMPEEESIIALVQLTHVNRIECSLPPTELTEWKYWRDPWFASIKPNEESLPYPVNEYMKLHVALFNQQAAMIKLMAQLVGLTAFFRQLRIQYMIFNGPSDLCTFEPDIFYQHLASDPGVLDLRSFNMLNLIGRNIHPDELGMQIIADYFIHALSMQDI